MIYWVLLDVDIFLLFLCCYLWWWLWGVVGVGYVAGCGGGGYLL